MSRRPSPPDSVAAEELGRRIARRLTGFLHLLRQHGFVVGQRESADALRLLASPLGERSALLQGALRALLCTRLAEWRRFDELFQAHWLGRGMKAAVRLTGGGARPRTLRELAVGSSATAERAGAVELAEGGESEDAGGRGKREGASRRESLERTDFRKLADPDAQ
ncbi:MAG TPA: hypothetical protein VJL84_02645, partial [Kiloniellales bacterium]|nr:hypothetical protein [Kiloniellales bacterium]